VSRHADRSSGSTADSAKRRAPTAAARLRQAPQEVRIIGGQWRRSRLPVLAVAGLRPTPDRVRETLFNWLGQDLNGWRCLDAFAGTGALGFEAASRGAAWVGLVEQDRQVIQSLRALQTRLSAQTVEVIAGEGLIQLRRSASGSLDLVFLDPPYDSDLLLPALTEAERAVPVGGWVYAEASETLPDLLGSLRLSRHLRAGQVHAHLYRREPATPADA